MNVSYRVLDTVERELSDPRLQWLKKAVGYAAGQYETLQGETVTVARIPDNDFAYARAFVTNRIIMLPTEHRVDWDTIYHELAHLAIEIQSENGRDVPVTSEEYCSIYATTAIEPSLIERDSIMYLGEPSVPKDEWAGICERALEYREENRDYIKQCKEWLGINE